MGAHQLPTGQLTDLDAPLKDAHQDFGADGHRPGRVAAVVYAHTAVVTDGALLLAEVLHPGQWQGVQVGAFFLEHGLHLAALGAVDALGRPAGLPTLQMFVLLFDGLKAFALEGRGLGVTNGMLHRPLAVGITYAGRISHHLVVLQHGRVHRVELGLVQVGFDHALLEVVQHHIPARAAEVAPGLFMQFGPDLLAGLPDHAPEAAPRVAQRGHKQPGLAVTIGARHPGWRPFAVVHLHLLARQEREPVKPLGLLVPQLGHEALDRVVGTAKTVLVNQVLVDRHAIAPELELDLDEVAMGLAPAGGH